MSGPGGTTACYDYYIVRIYHRGLDRAQARSELTGIVEAGDGQQTAFHGADDLLRILTNDEAPALHHPASDGMR